MNDKTLNATAKLPEEGIRIQNRHVSTLVWVTFDKVGFHRYPDAPEEVAYLRERHRHVFNFRVEIQVFHEDREVEFHMFKNWLTSLYDSGALEVDYKSCEMLAKDVLDKVLDKYDCMSRAVSVQVSEDGECGATLRSLPGNIMYLSPEVLLSEAARMSKGRLDGQGREAA